MSVTSGFFNSLNHDRRYNAQQMSAIFDGIINDGVFANIGVAFAINADTGVTITIGKGRAWFNSAWVYNDATLPKTLEGSEVVLDRIDAAVIEVDHNESVRMGDVKIVKGTPSSSPQRPVMVNTEKKSQHPLAYIYRKAGSTEITQADITNMVGTSECPYITGILQVQNIDNIVAQWEGQWNQWYSEKIKETDSDASELLAEMKSDFEIWFADVRALLEDDVATALAAEVAALQGKFDDLAKEGAVYDEVEDPNFDEILGSDGTPIQGKSVIGGGGGGGGDFNSAGGTMQGPIDMNGNSITGLADPVADGDAVNLRSVKGLNKPKAGFIYPLAASVVPEGFLLCDGAAYARSEYPELFAAIGTMYGPGDGATTFNVPDLRNRVPAGSSENHPAGETVGEEAHQLTKKEMPSHTHAAANGSHFYTTRGSTGGETDSGFASGGNFSGDTAGTGFSRRNATASTGGDQPHNNMQPTTYIRGYIIATGKGTGVSVVDIIHGAQEIPLEVRYGGTGATNSKTARENLEITPENIGALSMELLWENASPTSKFTPQTVYLDLSKYDYLVIVVRGHGGAVNESSNYVRRADGNLVILHYTSNANMHRLVHCYSDRLEFEDGNTWSNTVTQVDNSRCVPYLIYGIKGVSA